MPVSDWSTNPDLNTSVGGTFIGENCPPSNVNDGERQIMAEAKAKFDSIDAASGGASVAALGALTPVANKLAYYTGPTTAALADLTAYARTLLAAVDAPTAMALLGGITVSSFTPGINGVLSLLIAGQRLIIQWGTVTGPFSEGPQFIPFNVAFPAACWRAIPSAINLTSATTKDTWAQEGPLTLGGFTAMVQWTGLSTNSIDGIGYVAIGG